MKGRGKGREGVEGEGRCGRGGILKGREGDEEGFGEKRKWWRRGDEGRRDMMEREREGEIAIMEKGREEVEEKRGRKRHGGERDLLRMVEKRRRGSAKYKE